jgi:hypothetical protein
MATPPGLRHNRRLPAAQCPKTGRLWYACDLLAKVVPSTAVDGSRLPVADPRGPVSDSLRSLIDGARTVGASRVVTRGLLKLAYDICSQSASITDVQAVRTCPVSDSFPVRERAASTGSSARTATWCATTPRGSTLCSTGAAAGSLPRPASGPLRPVTLSQCQQRAERLPQLS